MDNVYLENCRTTHLQNDIWKVNQIRVFRNALTKIASGALWHHKAIAIHALNEMQPKPKPTIPSNNIIDKVKSWWNNLIS